MNNFLGCVDCGALKAPHSKARCRRCLDKNKACVSARYRTRQTLSKAARAAATSPEEEWRPVVGWEDSYQVSSLGRVRRIATFRVLSPGIRSQYLSVALCVSGLSKLKSCTVHRLVAVAFHPGYTPGLEVNHVDGNKLNNRADNLEWVTPADNVRHAVRLGLFNSARGERITLSKLTSDLIPIIRAEHCNGQTLAALGRRFGVTPEAISSVVKRRTWKHVA